jgi:hypothetical protein
LDRRHKKQCDLALSTGWRASSQVRHDSPPKLPKSALSRLSRKAGIVHSHSTEIEILGNHRARSHGECSRSAETDWLWFEIFCLRSATNRALICPTSLIENLDRRILARILSRIISSVHFAVIASQMHSLSIQCHLISSFHSAYRRADLLLAKCGWRSVSFASDFAHYSFDTFERLM